jgi:hypothetical protein
MLKAATHYEQVPLGLVMKIIEQSEVKKNAANFRGGDKQNIDTGIVVEMSAKKRRLS